MPIDSSIYQNVRPVPINIPSPLDAATGAMTLGRLGMQTQQMQLQMQQQQALRQAYVQNTDASGQVNNPGVASTLGKMGYGQMANEQAVSFAKQQKDQAEAQASAIDTQHKSLNLGLPILGDFIHNVPDDQKATTWPEYLKRMTDLGVQTQNFPKQYDPKLISTLYVTGSQTKEHIDNLKAQAEANKANAETGEIPGKRAHTAAETQKALDEAAKIRSETITRPPTTAINDPTTDPATLVPGKVLMQHQGKALEEIKNAQDVNRIAPQIMEAFQRGTSRNPLTAKQGQREFEGLINTTVKEAEGTTRQTAFDSIRKTMLPSGPSAVPGENDAKARTVLRYLQSKSSAPTAQAYGIDLRKYKSTAPYAGPDAKAPASSDQIKTANAGEKPAASSSDTAALQWLKTADPTSPEAFGIRAKLKKKGLL